MAVTAVDFVAGSSQQFVRLPPYLQGRLDIESVGIGRYRLFIVVLCRSLAIALQWVLSRTRFGSQLRAAVDDPRVARGLGINVSLLFAATFAVGSGLAGLFLAARKIVGSAFGLSLVAIRDNPLRAASVDTPVNARLVAIYAIAAAFAGAAGALAAQTTSFVSLDVFDVTRSADVLLAVVIGGAGSLYGGALGAVAFKSLQAVLSGWTPQYWHFWIGLALVVLVIVGRDRLASGPNTLLRSIQRRLSRHRVKPGSP